MFVEITPHGFCQCGCGRRTLRSACKPYRSNRYVRNHHPTRIQTPEQIAERFWKRVVRAHSGCWWWTGNRDGCDYGLFKSGGRTLRAHRVAWMLTCGDIPSGVQVLHRCDNPLCVNPSHLFLGNPAINAADREAKGRGHDQRGEKNGRAKLTEDQVREIRCRYAAGDVYQYELAAEFGVTQTMVSYIVRRKSWSVA